jgi:citrate synthase
VLVSAVDHGPQAPSIAVARMAATCGLGLNGAIASGVNTLGDVHGGTGQQCMELLQDADARHVAGADVDTAAAGAIAEFRERHGEFIPGYGHRFHPIDPRAVRLSQLVREAMRTGAVSGRYLAAGEAVQRALSKGKSKPLPMNIDGITAVVLLELGFPSELGRGVFILSRSVGICAHAFEQSRQGERIKGPTPPASGFRYSGVAPRTLPDTAKKSPP